MNSFILNFDLLALASPKSRADLVALAHEIIAELDRIDDHFDSAFSMSEETSPA
ncbi:hypothetical protein NB717_000020 [Xanthomonas sacchari]|uniref:hypothetical protein n=1 Tax=Xanthomonas sacchari TaxID=56458 RepID=UPI00225DE71C|nr:hypothetical protein [Xanthomonas sacchari]MCW0458952.1 hypothetical protein [Xanthomonas sacchari]